MHLKLIILSAALPHRARTKISIGREDKTKIAPGMLDHIFIRPKGTWELLAAALPLHQKGKRSCSPSISPSFRAKEGHSLLLQQKYLPLPTLGMWPVSHYNIKNTPTHSTPQ
jgi:hypothetical protein